MSKKNKVLEAALAKQEEKKEVQEEVQPNFTHKAYLPTVENGKWSLTELEVDPVTESVKFGKKLVNGNSYEIMFAELKKAYVTETFRKRKR